MLVLANVLWSLHYATTKYAFGEWLPLAVSVAGVVLVIQGGSGVAGVSLVGDLLAVGAAITWAAYSVMLRPLFGRYSAARISALMVSVGGVMILPFGLPQMHEQD